MKEIMSYWRKLLVSSLFAGIGSAMGLGLIKPGMIKILTYYQEQRRLVREKLNEINVDGITQAMKDAIEMSTVDSFQGSESRIVILDMVAGKERATSGRRPLSGPISGKSSEVLWKL